jgi:hypothetical protein
MEDHPEPTEHEDELASTERHHDEEAMRGPDHENPRREGEEDDEA